MPILHYDPSFRDLPDLDEDQKCDKCGAEEVGHLMYFSYSSTGASVLCMACYLAEA